MAIQADLLAVMVLAPRGVHWSLAPVVNAAGRIMEVLGVMVGLWAASVLGAGLTASPLPNGRVGLVSRGPYRWVRHPMYTAVMVFMAGVAVLSGSWPVPSALVILVALFNVKARWEEARLAEAFPGYADYRAVTNRFMPCPVRI